MIVCVNTPVMEARPKLQIKEDLLLTQKKKIAIEEKLWRRG